MTTTLRTNCRHPRGGLSTMAYVLWFAFAAFCMIIATFTLLARNPVQHETGQPVQPVTIDHPAPHG